MRGESEAFPLIEGIKLSDAIRHGSGMIPVQAVGWGDGVENACALTAAKAYLTHIGYTSETAK